jgi:hypothetical protein
MLMMKACPRCSGDLVRTRDPYEGDAMLSCMQCGYASYGRMIVSPTLELEANVSPSLTLVAVADGPRSEYDDLDAIEDEAGAAA